MGVLVNPYLFGVVPGIFLVGNNGAATANTAIGGNIQQGIGKAAALTGTANSLVILGSTATGYPSATFRLCIYAASSSTAWSGALLGKTGDVTGILINEVKSIPLISPVAIVAGQFYAITVHAASAGGWANSSNASVTDRFFSDTFSDGPLGTAPASSNNSSNGRRLYATT